MAALAGFDAYEGEAAVVTPITLGSTLLSVTIPRGVCVGGIDIDISDLDSDTSPLIKIDVGDAGDQDRFIAANTIAQDGGLLEYRPASTDWYRYSIAVAVNVKVATAPATGVAGGIAAAIYGYPSVDLGHLARRVLQQMGVLAEGETARAEDASLANEALADIHEMLRGRRAAAYQDLAWPLAYVPLFAVRPYAAMAANLLADTFSLPTAKQSILAQRADAGLKEMFRQTSKKTAGLPVSLEPYREPEVAVVDYSVFG